MYLTRISFHPQRKCTKEKVELQVDLYLSTLSHTGQISHFEVGGWSGGVFMAYVYAARPDAMALEHHSKWGREHLEELWTLCAIRPEWTLMDDETPSRFPRWDNSSFLVLYSDYVLVDHPIRRGRDGYGFPAYLFPLEDHEKHNLHCWLREYSEHMGLWFKTGKLEIPAYRQLADPKSELMEETREHCREIEKATQIPTYTFLFHYWGHRETDPNRRCPLCGRRWKLKKPFVCKSRSWKIDFLCKPCRLVSERACTFDNPRAARIGEYTEIEKPSRKRPV